jgi:hypothetical protein
MADSESGKTAVTIPSAQPNRAPNAATVTASRAHPRTPRGPAAAVIGHVNGRHTPIGMVQNRIPPRVSTGVTVTVTNGPIRLVVGGQSASNGTVQLRGHNEIQLRSGSHQVKLKGITQTNPGNANNLSVQAFSGTTLLASSNLFSVAAIPQNWKCTFLRRLDNRADPNSEVGFVVQDRWKSDSGVVADLNEAQISERVQAVGGTGPFAGAIDSNSGYLSAHNFSTDTHSLSPRRVLNRVGSVHYRQASMFLDRRTGAVDIPMKKSGYFIDYKITARRGHAGSFILKIMKKGAGTTALGIATAAGSGRIAPPKFIVP